MRSEDIAKLAGVSRSTVSRVINNYPNVPPETREKVLRVIEQHHYEPNPFARVLAGKGTNTLGLFVVSTAEPQHANRIYQNSYFAPFVNAVVDTANARGYYVLIHTVYSPADYQKVKQAFAQKRVDGGIMVGTQDNLETIRDIIEFGAPFVLIDTDLAEVMARHWDKDQLAVINSKDYDGARAAVEYLIALGHRDIGILQGHMSTFSGKQRFLACTETLAEHGLPLKEPYLLKGEFLKQTARDEVARLLRTHSLPTALFAANDDMAVAALEVFAQHDIRVPTDISIVGFDDVSVASQVIPNLTSVRVPIYDMSVAAVRTLIETCEQGSSSFRTISFPTELVIRASCQAPSRRASTDT